MFTNFETISHSTSPNSWWWFRSAKSCPWKTHQIYMHTSVQIKILFYLTGETAYLWSSNFVSLGLLGTVQQSSQRRHGLHLIRKRRCLGLSRENPGCGIFLASKPENQRTNVYIEYCRHLTWFLKLRSHIFLRGIEELSLSSFHSVVCGSFTRCLGGGNDMYIHIYIYYI